MKPIAMFILGGAVTAAWMALAAPNGSSVVAQEASSRPASGAAHWLSNSPAELRDQSERHFRGLDVAMMEIGHRFNELHYAGMDRNWPYAQYQIEKIELALRLALERRPKRAGSAKPFLDETIPFMKEAIRRAATGRDKSDYTSALERLRADCMTCHVAENVPHFTVHFSDRRPSSIGLGENR